MKSFASSDRLLECNQFSNANQLYVLACVLACLCECVCGITTSVLEWNENLLNEITINEKKRFRWFLFCIHGDMLMWICVRSCLDLNGVKPRARISMFMHIIILFGPTYKFIQAVWKWLLGLFSVFFLFVCSFFNCHFWVQMRWIKQHHSLWKHRIRYVKRDTHSKWLFLFVYATIFGCSIWAGYLELFIDGRFNSIRTTLYLLENIRAESKVD